MQNKDLIDKEVKKLMREVIGENEIQKMASKLVNRDPSSLQGKQHLFAIGRLSGCEEQRDCAVRDRGNGK